MRQFFLAERASQDLDEIREYLVERAGPGIARRIVQDIRRALILIGSRPGAGHVREDLTSRPIKFWPIYSYLIVYDPATRPVHIMRIVHGRRNMEEILRS